MQPISVSGSPTARDPVTSRVPTGAADVGTAAQALAIPVCDEEVTTILEDVTGSLNDLANSAVRAAVLSRIYEDVCRVSRGHEMTDDD